MFWLLNGCKYVLGVKFVLVCGFLEIVFCYGRLNCLGISVGCVFVLCRCEQWRTLIISPWRACLAQARCAGARPGPDPALSLFLFCALA